jgi:hypothetical protein
MMILCGGENRRSGFCDLGFCRLPALGHRLFSGLRLLGRCRLHFDHEIEIALY